MSKIIIFFWNFEIFLNLLFLFKFWSIFQISKFFFFHKFSQIFKIIIKYKISSVPKNPLKNQMLLKHDRLILPTSFSFPLLNTLTLLLIYAKNTSDLYIRWSLILSPTFIYLLLSIILSLKSLFSLEIENENHLTNLQIKLLLINNLFQMIFSIISLIFCIFLSEYLDFLDYPPIPITDFSIIHLYFLVCLAFLSYFIYAIFIKTLLNTEKTEKDEENHKKISLITILMNAIFSILGNTMTFCSTGACSSIYVSTLSAFFSAFGITIIDWLPYLRYSAVIFIIISIFSLYSAKKSFFYWPFIVCLCGSGLILASMMLVENNYMLYIGNLMMIGAAVGNARINKAGFGRMKVKQQVWKKRCFL